jgi:hypothetical protein
MGTWWMCVTWVSLGISLQGKIRISRRACLTLTLINTAKSSLLFLHISGDWHRCGHLCGLSTPMRPPLLSRCGSWWCCLCWGPDTTTEADSTKLWWLCLKINTCSLPKSIPILTSTPSSSLHWALHHLLTGTPISSIFNFPSVPPPLEPSHWG